MPQTKLVSFVLPVHNESENIDKLLSELFKLAKSIHEDFEMNTEFIFVNDYSSDDSLAKLQTYYNKVNNIKIIDFSRNFGHQIAITAGMDLAGGDAVIIMDSDLQDPPEVCLEMLKKWQAGAEVVYAKRNKYKTNWLKEQSAFWFYRILDKIADTKIPKDTGDFRLLDKKANQTLKKFREKSRFMRGLSAYVGFKQDYVLYDRADRFAGKPTYTFIKSLKLALDGITGFSFFPLKLISIIGFWVAFISFLLGGFYVIFSLFTQNTVSGWASTMISIYFIGGVQMLMLGIIAEYISRIYQESLNRPLYIIDKIWEKPKAGEDKQPLEN